MLLEKLETIKKLWEHHLTCFPLNDNSTEDEIDLALLNEPYSNCIADLIDKDGKIPSISLVKLRSTQQEIILMTDSCNDKIQGHLFSLEKVGELILENY
ncbi:MAG: hypothetical protein COB02_11290 [Candidatus Cloacimonadota bacterium]|nr:MAG: hypothetical protein COB02_11290 [Candidatus Cloacimonadota bacterium]